MSVFDSLRKGFGFLLMSFGISRPPAKATPASKPAPDANRKPGNGQPS
jgi:hypothetical protein